MSRKTRLELVRRITQDRVAQAQRVAALANAALRDSESQLKQLLGYREEYRKRFMVTGESGMSAQSMREFQSFLARIDKAIGMQQDVVHGKAVDLERHSELWTEIRKHEKSLARLLQQRAKAEMYREDRLEQKLSDDSACTRRGKYR